MSKKNTKYSPFLKTFEQDKIDSEYEYNVYKSLLDKRNFEDPKGLSDSEYKRLFNKFIEEYNKKKDSLLVRNNNNELIIKSSLNNVINKMDNFINNKLSIDELNELFALNLFEVKYIYNKYLETPKQVVNTIEKSFNQTLYKSNNKVYGETFEYKKIVDDLTPLIRKYVNKNRLDYLRYELKKIMIKNKKFFKKYNINDLVDTWYNLLVMDIDLQYETLKNKIDSYYKNNKVNYSNYILYNTKVTINHWLKFNKQFITIENNELKNVIKYQLVKGDFS